MGHARKQLFFSRKAYSLKTCPIYNSIDVDTWLHVLLKCKQQHIHVLITKGHNKVVWKLRLLILSNEISINYTHMNTLTYNGLPQENTIPIWLLLCTCNAHKCHDNAMFKVDTLCIICHPYNHPPPEASPPYLTI